MVHVLTKSAVLLLCCSLLLACFRYLRCSDDQAVLRRRISFDGECQAPHARRVRDDEQTWCALLDLSRPRHWSVVLFFFLSPLLPCPFGRPTAQGSEGICDAQNGG
jgi:hypothetical protein